MKKVLSLALFIIITSSFSIANAKFTWFGLKNNDTEVIIHSSDSHIEYRAHDHHPYKTPKHKKKDKPKLHKGPNFHKWWKKNK